MTGSIIDEFDHEPAPRPRAISTAEAKRNASLTKNPRGNPTAPRWLRQLRRAYADETRRKNLEAGR